MSERFQMFDFLKKRAKNSANLYFREKLEGYSLKWARIRFDRNLSAYNYHALFYREAHGAQKYAEVRVDVKHEGAYQFSFQRESILSLTK